jgi:hypothetical protein
MRFSLTPSEARETALRLDRIKTDLTDSLARIRANGNFRINEKGQRIRVKSDQIAQFQANIDALWVAAESLRGNVTIIGERLASPPPPIDPNSVPPIDPES